MGLSYINQLLVRPLSVINQAEVLRIVYNCPAATVLSQTLGKQLSAIFTADWVTHASLAEVFAVTDALHYYDSTSLSGTLLAAIAKRLIASEVTVGGPYAEADQKPTVQANAYIASCLEWLAAPLPKVDAFLQEQLRAGRVTTSEAIIISRSQNDSPVPDFQPPTDNASAQQLALAIVAAQPHRAPKTAHQGRDVARQVRVEALAKPIYNTLPEPLRHQALQVFDRLLKVDGDHEIRLLPHYFADAHNSQAVRDGLLDQLGSANIHAWLAYTIYDDFFDDEGQPPLLAVANVALRAATNAFRSILPEHTAFQATIKDAFMAVDAANNWETLHWRSNVSKHSITIGKLPDYGNRQILADRALLHIMGPLAVLMAQGVGLDSKEGQACLGALRHYLIARQLTDDLHDWADDLRAGHLSYIVSEILRGLALLKGTYRLEQLMPLAQRHFWQQAVPELCQTTLEHITQAREGLRPYLRQQDNQLFFFLDRLEVSMKAALTERQQGQEFLQQL